MKAALHEHVRPLFLAQPHGGTYGHSGIVPRLDELHAVDPEPALLGDFSDALARTDDNGFDQAHALTDHARFAGARTAREHDRRARRSPFRSQRDDAVEVRTRQRTHARGPAGAATSTLCCRGPIHATDKGLTTPAKRMYMQIVHGEPSLCFRRAVAMMGVRPLAKIPENWYTNEMPV